MAKFKIDIKDPKKVRFVKQLLKEYGLKETDLNSFSDRKPVIKKKTISKPKATSDTKPSATKAGRNIAKKATASIPKKPDPINRKTTSESSVKPKGKK